LLLLYVEKISVKKLMIALGLGAGLTAFNYVFGQSLDASKYVTSTMHPLIETAALRWMW
jgi:putative colanic acid polymerase